MKRNDGDERCQIWLLGDSEPANWADKLDLPLDARHPIRHNIWTSVLDVIQDEVYKSSRIRVDAAQIFIRNAIINADSKPKRSEVHWNGSVYREMLELSRLLKQNGPIMVLCFGAFSFEFARRSIGEPEEKPFGYWGSKKLGAEFKKRMEAFSIEETNLVPMLHRSLAGGKFIESHNNFCSSTKGNYFKFVGTEIAWKLIQYQSRFQIWIR